MRATGSDWSSRPDESFFIPRSTRSQYPTCNEAPAETTIGFIVARQTSDPYPKLCATTCSLSTADHHQRSYFFVVMVDFALLAVKDAKSLLNILIPKLALSMQKTGLQVYDSLLVHGLITRCISPRRREW